VREIEPEMEMVEWADPRMAARYRRNLGTLSPEGQGRLLASHALVAGLGGLGGHVVEQLARCGVGQITGVDPDVFDETNLNRQLLATTASLGRRKVEVAQERVNLLNPACAFTTIAGRHRDVPETLRATVDIAFDCLDSVADRLDLAGVCARTSRVLVHGAVAGWYGQVAVVWPRQNVLAALYPQTGLGWEQDLGAPPFTVALTASLMVTQGIKLLIGAPVPCDRRVEFLDLWESRWLTTTL
jgi:molybdopterin/thiamine biosynthesis adenylyltransferase